MVAHAIVRGVLRSSYSSAGNGGGVYIAGTSATSVTLVNITASTLMGNTATGTAPDGLGGGMYITGGVSALASTKFTGNLAEDYGGGLAYEYSCFHSTSSLLGKEVSNAFSWAALSPETQQLAAAAGNCSLLQSWSDPFVNNHASIAGGAVYAIDLASLNLTCVDGQLATDNLQAGCAAWANNTVQIASDLVNGTQASALNKGTISIADLSLVAPPGDYIISMVLPEYSQVAAAIILVQLRKCVIGEVEATPETCVACLANTYSLNSTDQSCYACPPNANCTGGADLVPLQQYWHSAPDSDFMVSCPNSNACKGDREELLSCKAAAYAIQAGQPAEALPCNLTASMSSRDATSYMVKQCSTGYYGPVCSLCLKIAEDGKRGSGVVVFSYFASTVLVLIWLTYTIQVTLRENREDADGVANPGRTSELIRALTLWLQYITLLSNVNNTAPEPIHWIFNAASFAFSTVTSGSLSTDCLQTGNTNPAVERVLIHLAVPVMVLVILVFLQTVGWLVRTQRQAQHVTMPPPNSLSNPSMPSTTISTLDPQSKRADLRHRLLVTLLSTVFYYYPSVHTVALSLFQCYHIDPRSRQAGQNYPQNALATWKWDYWVPDMSVQCFAGWHLGLSLALGIPLLLLVVTIMLMVLVIGITVLAHCQPFEERLSQSMQVLGLFTTVATATGCLYFLDQDSIAVSGKGLYAAGVLLLILNLFFVVLMAALIAREGAPHLKQWAVWLM
ncbi:hypothetical protein WJX82_004122 [Trebouxia sp. C0006]